MEGLRRLRRRSDGIGNHFLPPDLDGGFVVFGLLDLSGQDRHMIIEFFEEVGMFLYEFDNGLGVWIRFESFLKGHSWIVNRFGVVLV